MAIIAAYADPADRLDLIMIPALDHGTRPGRAGAAPNTCPAGGSRLVSEVTRTVMLPLPASGSLTK